MTNSKETVNPGVTTFPDALQSAVSKVFGRLNRSLVANGFSDYCVSTPIFPTNHFNITPEKAKISINHAVKNSVELVTIVDDLPPIIGTPNFSAEQFASDISGISVMFGFSKEDLFAGLDNDDAIFKKAIDVLDAILSVLHLVPMDQISETRQFANVLAKGLRTYLPKIEDISKILANAPGLNRFSKVLVDVGISLDKAIDKLERNPDGNGIESAIECLRDSLKQLRKISISDIDKETRGSAPFHKENPKKKSKKDKTIIDINDAVVVETPPVTEEATETTEDNPDPATDDAGVSDEEIAKAMAFNQQLFNPMQMYVPHQPVDAIMTGGYTNQPVDYTSFFAQMGVFPPSPQPPVQPMGTTVPPQPPVVTSPVDDGFFTVENMTFAGGYIPDPSITATFLDGSLDRKEPPAKEVPAFIEQNTVKIPRCSIDDTVYAAIKQAETNPMAEVMKKYSWARELRELVNDNGYFVQMVPWNNGVIAIGIYKDGIFLQDKSFLIDMGAVIDKRFAIWPVANPDGTFNFIESAKEAYYLFDRDGNLNTPFIESVIKIGFSNIDKMMKKASAVYSERVTTTNRRIAMMSLDAVEFGKNRDNRGRIKGCCIRMATKIDPALGRFRFASVNPKTMEFVLTNENSGFFMDRPMAHVEYTDLVCTPKRGGDGRYLKINEKGTDIQFDVRYITRPIGSKVTALKSLKEGNKKK